MTNQKPPREFFILDSLYENERRAYKSKPTGHDSIHVIEHTAYLSEKTKREQFEKLAGEMREVIALILQRDKEGYVSFCGMSGPRDKAEKALAKFDEALKGMKNETE